MASKAKDIAEAFGEGGDQTLHPVQKLPPNFMRQRIVVMHAQFQGVGSIKRQLLEETGLEVDARTIAALDPRRPYAKLSVGLRRLYETARRQHLEDLSTIGVAHQAHRLRVLDRVVNSAENKREFGTVMSALKQAAEEMGGVLTNVRRLQHSGAVASVHMSVEDAKAALLERLSTVIDEGVPVLPAPFPYPEDAKEG